MKKLGSKGYYIKSFYSFNVFNYSKIRHFILITAIYGIMQYDLSRQYTVLCNMICHDNIVMLMSYGVMS